MRSKIDFSPTKIERMAEMKKSGTNYEDIGKIFGCSGTTIRKILVENGFVVKCQQKKGIQMPEDKQMEVCDYYKTGISLSCTADKFGLSFQTTRRIIIAHGIEIQQKPTTRRYLRELELDKEEAVETEQKVVDCKDIRDCKYKGNVGVIRGICNYCEMEHHSRGCPPSECDKYKRIERRRRSGIRKRN